MFLFVCGSINTLFNIFYCGKVVNGFVLCKKAVTGYGCNLIYSHETE